MHALRRGAAGVAIATLVLCVRLPVSVIHSYVHTISHLFCYPGNTILRDYVSGLFLLIFALPTHGSCRLVYTCWPSCKLHRPRTNKRDLPLIIKIQEYFGGIGNISHYTKNNAVQFIVADLKSINERIIPQFDTYVFCGNKLTNYLIWTLRPRPKDLVLGRKGEILMLVNSKAHLTTEGLKTIEGLKSNLNQW